MDSIRIELLCNMQIDDPASPGSLINAGPGTIIDTDRAFVSMLLPSCYRETGQPLNITDPEFRGYQSDGATLTAPDGGNVKFGRTLGLSPSGFSGSAIWNVDGPYTGHPTGPAETLEVFSSDSADAGKTIRISGLGDTGLTVSEDVILDGTDGTTPVQSSISFTRANRGFAVGSPGFDGDVTVRHSSTTSNVFIVMPGGANQSKVGAFSVPYNQRAEINSIYITMTARGGGNGSAKVVILMREPGQAWREIRDWEINANSHVNPPSLKSRPIKLAPGTDIVPFVKTISNNNTYLTSEIEYNLFDS